MDPNRPIMPIIEPSNAQPQPATEALLPVTAGAAPDPEAEAGQDLPAANEAADPQPAPPATGPIPRWTRPLPPPLHTPTTRNPSLPTFAGLVMLILTFFIVLTSISMNDRKKSEAAMASLQDTFASSKLRLDRAPETDSQEVARDFIVGLTGEVQSLVPLMGGKKAIPAEDQILWLPLSLAFGGAATELDPGFVPVLRELLNASAKIPPRFDYQVEVRLCATEASDGLRRRATALATALAGLRAPSNRFVIGTQACQPDRIGFAVALAPVGLAEAAPGGNP